MIVYRAGPRDGRREIEKRAGVWTGSQENSRGADGAGGYPRLFRDVSIHLARCGVKPWRTAHFGVKETVETSVVCVDPRPRGRQYQNVWHNAIIRSTLCMMTAPCAGGGAAVRRR